MIESNREEGDARPTSGRAFLKRQASVPPGLTPQLIFWSSLAIGLGLDLWTKRAVFNWLHQKPGNSFPIIKGFLQLVLAVNDGAAFGLFSGHRYKLMAISFIVLLSVFLIFLFSKNQLKLFYVGLGIFGSGVCGNLYDRIFNDGLVRDFIDVVYWPRKHWPAFNIGDSLLCIGIGIIIISSLRSPKHPSSRSAFHITEKSSRKHAPQHK